jgi:hypothetical protein
VLSAENLLRAASLFPAALATGALIVNWIGLARAMLRLSSASAYIEFHQASSTSFDPYMPVLVNAAAVGGIVLAVMAPDALSIQCALAVLGALGYLGIVVFSLRTNVRMNRQIARWNAQDPPGDWQAVRARWVRFHILRTLISVPALLFYLLSALDQTSP